MTMKTRIFASVVVLAAVTSSMGHSLHAGERVPLAVIVSKGSSLNDLSYTQLTRMYMGELVDFSGGRLIPLNRSTGTEERQLFDRLVLGKSPDEMARYWID